MPTDTGPAELGLQFLVRDIARLLHRRFEQGGHALGLSLTRAQCFLLVRVEQEPGMNQARLAQLMNVEPIALVRLIDRLEAEKLLERRLDPRDRRVWRLYLTETAAPVIERIRRIGAAVAGKALMRVPQPEIEALLATLNRLKTNLSEGARVIPVDASQDRAKEALSLAARPRGSG